MILQLLVENNARLPQAINVEGIPCFHDLPQQKTLGLLQQNELARSSLHFGDTVVIDFNRVLLYFTLEHGPKPSDIDLEQKGVVSLFNQNLVARHLDVKRA